MLNDVEFREVQEVTKIEKVKIVACDGKSKFFYENCFYTNYNCLFVSGINEESTSKKWSLINSIMREGGWLDWKPPIHIFRKLNIYYS